MQKRTIAALALSAVMIPAAAFAQGNGNGNGRANGQRDVDRAQMRFREMDTDNDGVITRDEWRRSAQSFREHDRNHDGVLSGKEVWVDSNRRDSSRREEPVTAPRRTPVASAQQLSFTATAAYCTGRLTSSGTPVSGGVAAADPKVLPVGTVIRIAGAAPYDGTYRVLDTGPRVRNRQVDLYIADCAAARRFGHRPVRVTIVKRAE